MPKFIDDVIVPLTVTVQIGDDEVVLLEALLREPDPEAQSATMSQYADAFAAAGIDLSEALRPGEDMQEATPRLIAGVLGDKGIELGRALTDIANRRLAGCIVEWDGDEPITPATVARLPSRARNAISRTIRELMRERSDAMGESKSSSETPS